MKKRDTIPIDHHNTDPQYWESLLEKQGLGVEGIEDPLDKEREEIWSLLDQSIKRERHIIFAVPRSREELIRDLYAAVEELTFHHSNDITWTIHTSCSFGCDCIILAAKEKKSLHINSVLIPDYDRGEALQHLRGIGTENKNIYV